MRRKLIVLLLAAMAVACVMGCGGDSGKDTGKADSSTTNEDDVNDDVSKDEDAGDADSSSDTTYATYEDFTSYERIPMTEIYFNHPHWGEESMYDGKIISRDTNDFDIIMAYNTDTPYTGDIENILEQTYPEFVEIMREEATLNRDVNPSDILTTEKVTFDNGIVAIKFEGVHPGYTEDWGPYPVFGYSFVYENVNITMGYVLDEDTPELREEYEEEIQDVVYRIITTLRVGKE